MIYTNFKIKQSNGPGVECQRFLLSKWGKEEQKEREPGELRTARSRSRCLLGLKALQPSPSPQAGSSGDSTDP